MARVCFERFLDEKSLSVKVLINKEDTPYEPLERFCLERDLPILGRIPYDPKIGAMAAKGELVCEKIPELQALFLDLLKQIGGAV